ncbi:MAG: sigma-54-dependent Fis family transcriptional regulator [Deltaproteobacteria bacterium]|nr:sigma-54-dependent Fis family transcriptional regulator [Deltaproteobacteria bacterium]
MNQKRIMVVDDEPAHRLMLKAHLEEAGFAILEAGTGEEALDLVASEALDLILLDLRMPGMDGLEVLENLSDSGLPAPVIIMTAYGSINSAVKALKMGAEDYLTKPLDTDELLLKIEKVLKLKDLDEIRTRQEEDLARKYDFDDLKGRSPPMLALKETLALVAPSEITVLILGESGSGKEVVARAVHRNSPRRNKPFVAINCAAVPETLLESELFGHEKGAFTGAHQRKIGRFELAHQGVLLLDEVGELSLTTQAKLLRILEEKTFERLGGTKTLKVDVRLLTASNRDLEEEIEKGRFREDLYYRLNVVQIIVPSLRERGPGEVGFLAEHFLVESASRNRKSIKGFRPRALKALISHTWPGNVRELINAIERAVVLARGDYIEFEDLPLAIQSGPDRDKSGRSLTAGMTLKEVEAELIQRTLEETGGNRTKSAAMLGITRQTLLNKIKEYNL